MEMHHIVINSSRFMVLMHCSRLIRMVLNKGGLLGSFLRELYINMRGNS
jgi:hypothetical protein